MATTNSSAEENPRKTLTGTEQEQEQHQHPSSDPQTTEGTDTDSSALQNLPSSTAADPKDGNDVSKQSGGGSLLTPAEDTVSNTQKKIRRAERFGMPVQLSEEEKKRTRAERFGTGSGLQGSDAVKNAEEQKRKARAERFGLTQSVSCDDEVKKKARLARFAPASATNSVEENKKKARALRFSETPISISQGNGKGNIEPKSAITGKAGGGA